MAIHSTLKASPVENLRPLRVVVIGAGFSGIYLGIRIPEWLRNIDLTIYEKNAGVGGTWWENRYPGCACDIPAHSYVYSFEPNPEWDSFYASAPDICGYLDRTCKKYAVDRFLKLSHKVQSCSWDGDKSKWDLEILEVETGRSFLDEADVLINARGALNDYVWPDIRGLSSFNGKLMHSAAWDTNVDFSNKRVGVIGNGSSAIQIIPELQKSPGVELKCFARSPTWISQSFGHNAMEVLGLTDEKFSEEDQKIFKSDPSSFLHFRKVIESESHKMHAITLRNSEASLWARDAFAEEMRLRLKKKPEIADFLIPKFAPACRRLTPGPGYLEALSEDNVELVCEPISSIESDSILLKNGREIELDILICATGFNAAAAPPFPVVGVDGKTLKARFDPFPEAYMSLAVDGFPNMFLMLGPNAGVGTGSLTTIIEKLGDYIIKCIRKLQKEDISSMMVSSRSTRNWSHFVEEYFAGTVFLDNCKSWYRQGNRVIGLWPGSTLHALEALRSPRWEDFEYTYASDGDGKYHNPLWWLGNGWSIHQIEGGDMSYYINPDHVDVPLPNLPEQTPRWQALPFSH